MSRRAASVASDDGGLDVVKEVKRAPLERFLEPASQRPA